MALPRAPVLTPILAAALQRAGVNSQTVAVRAAAAGTWPANLTGPAPGRLGPLDQISIAGVLLPLAEMPRTGLKLDVDAKKAPGGDYKSYTSKGLEQEDIEIKLLLFRDLLTGTDWWEEWYKVSPLFPARKLDKRNGVSVYHPSLYEIGTTSILFTARSNIQRQSAQFFTVTLKGLDVRRIKTGGASKKAVQDKELQSRQGEASQQYPGNSNPPGANYSGQPRYPGPVVVPKREPLQSLPNQSVPPAPAPTLPTIYQSKASALQSGG